MEPVKLTKKTAVMLIQRVIPLSPKLISGGAADNGAVRFTAPVGPEGLEITCENDWFTHNGCIKLTISDKSGGGLSPNCNRKPHWDHVNTLPKTRSNYSTVAIWAWGNKKDLSMVEGITFISSHGYCSWTGTTGLAYGTRPGSGKTAKQNLSRHCKGYG